MFLPKVTLAVITIHKQNIHNRKKAPLAASCAIWVDCTWHSGTWWFRCLLGCSKDLWKHSGFLHRILSFWTWNLSL